MKQRIGFVSNSSSSSFCIIGKIIPLDCITKYQKNVYFLGEYIGEGQDVVLLDNELKKIIKSDPHKFDDSTFVVGLMCGENHIDNKINKKDLPGFSELDVIVGSADQHSSYNKDVFIKRYINKEEE